MLWKKGRGWSFEEKEVLDAVREEEAGGSVEAAPTQRAANTDATELRKRAGTWGRKGGRWLTVLYCFISERHD